MFLPNCRVNSRKRAELLTRNIFFLLPPPGQSEHNLESLLVGSDLVSDIKR